jgi:outer membrane lipoprotein SlyB
MKTNTSRKTSRVTFWLALLSSTTLLAACSTNAPYGAQQNQNSYPSSYQNNANSYGYIEAIQIIHANTNASSGGGAIAGGLVGALLGNQIGNGSGRPLRLSQVLSVVRWSVTTSRRTEIHPHQTSTRFSYAWTMAASPV